MDADLAITIFQDASNTLAVIFSDLAKIAEDRNEILVEDQLEKKDSGLHNHSLSKFLLVKASNVASRTAFRVAVVGEFSRGKSTLINALLGKEILPSDFRPNTAVKTVLRYNQHEHFRVTFRDPNSAQIIKESGRNQLRSDLSLFTSDMSINSDKAYELVLKGEKKSLAEEIKEVEVFCDAEFLKTREIELIDTPGLGSVFPQHREVTYGIIPSVDATIFVIQVDPGVGESEILFLKYVREYVNQIFFVVTKADMARSPDELQEMLRFVKDTIQVQTEIKVEHLFPVSALKMLQNNEAESGFDTFLPALEKFLVSSSGVTRLEAPLSLTRYWHGRLLAAAESDLNAIDKDISILRNELDRLQTEEQRIRRMRDKLIRDVDHQVTDLILIATEGIEFLPALIQKNVEAKVDSLKLTQLNKVMNHIQPVIKDTVTEWLGSKESKFTSMMEILRQNVIDDLKDIMDSIQPDNAEINRTLSFSVNMPHGQSVMGGQVGRIVGSVAVNGAIGFAAGLGAAGIIAGIIGVTTAAAVPAVLLLLPIVGAAVPAASNVFNLRKNIQEQIKRKLLEPLPGNKVNTYTSIVEGFIKDGQKVSGVKEVIQREFAEWSQQYQTVIVTTINSNLESRLAQLQRQIAEKEGGQQNQAQLRTALSKQKECLDDLDSRINSLAQQLNNLQRGMESRKQTLSHHSSGN